MRRFIMFCTALAVSGLPRLGVPPARAADSHVRLNEIAWMGTAVSPNDEWIELHNPTAADVALDGWCLSAADGQPDIALSGTVAAGGYFLLERTDDDSAPGVPADAVYAGSLGNGGEALTLWDAGGNAVDTLLAADGWPGGDNGTKQTLAFRDGAWGTSAGAGGTPGAPNEDGAPADEGDDRGDESEDVPPESDDAEADEEPSADETATTTPATAGAEEEVAATTPRSAEGSEDSDGKAGYHWGDVVINEFVADPADGAVEWVELYNPQAAEIPLAEWAVRDGSGARTPLTGSMAGYGFAVVEKPKGALNNGGDLIELYWKDAVIDRVAYGDYAADDGTTLNNAPAAPDPYSVARKGDGINTFHNARDFSATSEVTKGAANRIVDPAATEEAALPAGVAYDYATDVRITELLPNPFGADNEEEFIELYNAGSRPVDLAGWAVSDDGARKYVLKRDAEHSWQIPAGGYLTLPRPLTRIVLNNAADSVRLWQPLKDTPLHTVKYANAPEGQGYAYATSTNDWIWSETLTPGAANIIAEQQYPPAVDFSYSGELRAGQVVQFDSSDTVDRNGDALSFSWRFGSLATSTDRHPLFIFPEPGAYRVSVRVSDGGQEAVAAKTLVIAPAEAVTAAAAATTAVATEEGERINVVISEFLPDPEGSDADGEWIELYNAGAVPADLSGWQLDDGEGGSRPYALTETVVPAGGYLVFHRADTGLALNNENDAVRLLDPAGGVAVERAYGATTAGAAYAAINGSWHWTLEPTPGAANVLRLPPAPKARTSRSGTVKGVRAAGAVALAEVAGLDVGDAVTATGTVAVAPGVLGSQYFYLTDPAGRGLQVYSYKKAFPPLTAGSVVSVTGEISSANGEKRIKTAAAADIRVLASSTPPVPAAVTTELLGTEQEAQLVALTGEVVDRKGSAVWLDDGFGEVEVYIKQSTGIDKGRFVEGETVTVAGLYLRGGAGFRLYPRANDDITIVKGANAAAAGAVLGAVSAADEWALAPRSNREAALLYLAFGSLAAGVGGGAVVWRRRRRA